MNRKRMRRALIPLLVLTLALSILPGCGAKVEPVVTTEPTAAPESTQTAAPTPAPTNTPAPTVEPSPSPSPEPTPEPTAEPTPEPTPEPTSGPVTGSDDKPVLEPIVNPDGSITVFTVNQLLDAVAPGAVIELAEGVYNLSTFADSFDSEPSGAYWYFDWGTLVLIGAQDLTIRARVGDGVELVTEDSYADVLKLMYCENVSLEGLTMGHAVEPGRCIGGVVELSYCKDIRLQNLDLYGCGTYGLIADHCVSVYTGGSVIRECSYGILDMRLCSDMIFNGCTMRDCAGYEQLNLTDCVVEFQVCAFTGNQSDYGFLPAYNTNDILFSYCDFGTWELERLKNEAPMLSRVSYAWDEERPTSYDVFLPKSFEELLEDIRPNAMIQLWDMYPGTYDLSAYLEAAWAQEGEAWNDSHQYVRIRECYDGLELVVHDCPGLSIVNPRGYSDYELTVDPRYASVLTFVNCDNLTLRGFTLGHTETGECWGNVLSFESCHGVILRDLDLYGCGFFGISLERGCSGFQIYDSLIRDCSAGPLSIENCKDTVCLVGCTLTGSAGGGYYWNDEGGTAAYFLRCTFGDQESAMLLYDSSTQAEFCQWSDDYADYPDYEWEDDYPYDPANAAPMVLYGDTLTDNYWVGWSYTEKDGNEEAVLLPWYDEDGYTLQFYLSFSEDGTGLLEMLSGGEVREFPFTWVIAANYSADIFMDDTGISQGSVGLYFEEHDDDDGYHNRCWLYLSLNGDTYWFY